MKGNSIRPGVRLTSHTQQKATWFGGLDGLRTVAVLLVVLFHLETRDWVPGGFIGVDLFFVLSGFLITSLMLVEFERDGTLDLRAFYLRRAKRLLPPLFVTLGLVSFVSLVLLDVDSRNHPSLRDYAHSMLGAVLYGFNWLVALAAPYMRSLVHLWSLSIEEQFYILWPLALLGMLRAGVSRQKIERSLMALIALSLSIPFWYWDWTWTRLYYASDYRSHAMLAGCLLALMWSDPITRERMASAPHRGIVAWGALALLVAVTATANLDTAELYLGGFALVVLASATVIHWTLVASPESWTRRFLDAPPMVWLGKRSYGIYLYHMPLVVWTREFEVGLVDQAILVCGTTLLLCEFSYRMIERPLIEGRWPIPSVTRSPASIPNGATAHPATARALERP